ncbi:MAG: LPS assembly lipoprotein LptE [Thalassovita sp.]
MWLSKRLTLGLICAAALTGCGFAPAYGPSGAAGKLQSQIIVDAPTDRDQQLLVQELENRLGRTGMGRYALGYQLTYEQARMAVSADNTTTRFNIVGQADYTLRDSSSQQVLTQGKVTGFTGYSTTSSTVATLASEQDARERLAVMLADRIVTRLIAAAPGISE